MTRKRSRRALTWGLAIAVVGALLATLRPWTVVPIETTAARAFDPERYVASIWDSRVLPAAHGTGLELQTFMAAGAVGAAATDGRQTRAVLVKGTARIADVDRKSRVGVARLQLPVAKDGKTAAIQIGPVLRGTALRDALDFIQFTDFVNQLEFAGVANALNERVLSDVLSRVNLDDVAGREVTFIGAVPVSAAGTVVEIVPVQLQVAGGAK